MAPPPLTLQDIHLTFGGDPLLTGAELMVAEAARVCLVGRNGSGKSTLLKIAAGLVEPDRGDRFVQPRRTVRYLPQEADFAGSKTVHDYVCGSLGPNDGPHRAERLAGDLGLDLDQAPSSLSGGEARRAAIARTLAPDPDILLLDEPTNHLDLPAIEWLEAELASSRAAIVLISHDRRFLENLSNQTVWLDRGITRHLGKGFSAFEAWRDDVLEQEQRDHHKLGRKIAMEEEWIKYGVTARRKRNQKRLADLHALRERHRTHRKAAGTAALKVDAAEASGRIVIEASGISKSFDGKTIVKDVSIKIHRGDRVGIIGANGAGKTTLLNMLTGKLAPDTGEVRLGTGLEIVSLEQQRGELDPKMTLADALTGGSGDQVMVNGSPRHVIGYMKDFLFVPEQARTPVARLSGGERGRLLLARALSRPANLLVLDEPTNDLDLETLDLLQETIAEFAGTIVLVSHDRDFLDRIVTSTLASEGNGRWLDYAGGYSDMIAQRRAGATSPAAGAAKATGPRQRKSGQPDKPKEQRKLSFKDKHALETLPGQIAGLETAIAQLQAKMADPQLYQTDPDTYARSAADLQKAEADLAAAEERWLQLEMLREELESG